MGCNCKVNQHALKMHNEYGYNSRVSWKERLDFNFIKILQFTLVSILLVIFFPIIILIVSILIIGGKRNFNISNLVRRVLDKNKNG